MLIKPLFLRLFEPDQSKIKEIFQEIVNIHNGGDFLKRNTRILKGKDRLPNEWDKTAEMLRKTVETVLRETFGKRKGDVVVE